ncbi:MAG TPA: AMP-binding protein [Rhizomicrobium sp.]|jgi:fatty-acyl-CoA synthase
MARRKGSKPRKGAPPSRRAKARKVTKPARAAKPKNTQKIVPPSVRPRTRKASVRRDLQAPRPAQRPKTTAQRSPYDIDLARNPANYQPLTPLTFLERAASVFPDRVAIIHGGQRFTYAQFYQRARRLASALAARGIRRGDTVAVMLANTPPMLEAHYGVPMTGAVLNTLNTRLDAAALGFILDHGEAKVLITDREFSDVIGDVLKLAKVKPLVIDYNDPEFPQTGARLGEIDYEDFLAGGDPDFEWRYPDDEWDAISLNYTSGTTGNPKGVVFHHRGLPVVPLV